MKDKFDYKKLKQMDRIEYLLLRNNNEFPSSSLINVINNLIYITFWIINFALLVYIIDKNTFVTFMIRIRPLFYLFKPIIIVFGIIDVVFIIRFVLINKKIKKYFMDKK